ncbi:hypothetical protein NM208_g6196 [Fusarium decemcellulare]|uniref:Uncharacterized protein n=1 Tax=Fusarium decemcellulare TaxID=57161 RepID=A0ACC1SE07_9HYPO|nr:hypothetical protein NM208_g6196 [Fusarium decemcellulare]
MPTPPSSTPSLVSWRDSRLGANLDMSSTKGPIFTAFVLILIVSGVGWVSKLLHLFRKQTDYLERGMDIFTEMKTKTPNKPFKLTTLLGDITVLPRQFIDPIRNDKSLSFRRAITRDFHAHLPGFEAFAFLAHPTQILPIVLRKQLTKYLNTVTEPLSSEASFATHHIFGESRDWQKTLAYDSLLDLIARLSSRVFLGDEICRNEDWLKVTKNYTVISFASAAKLNVAPAPLRPLMNWFDPSCKEVRANLNQARRIISPVIEKRRQLKAKAMAAGQPVPTFNDAIDWAETECQGKPYDAAVFQLTLSFVAIHTSTDLLYNTMMYLVKRPEFIDALRQEIIGVLRAEGWKKTALYNMKLVDSALKEAQRLLPGDVLTMRRQAVKDVTLPDGTVLQKGERIMVDNTHIRSAELYSDPEEFDLYRFRNLRGQLGNENKAQFVSTSPDHLGFGHGMYACPGRFFASNELKVALCHLLLKYDWKLEDPSQAQTVMRGTNTIANPRVTLLFRRRKEELDLETLGFGDS